MFFSFCNLLNNSSQSPHDLEAETTTRVYPLFFRLGTELWDLNDGENRERDEFRMMNLTLRTCGEKMNFGLILQFQITKLISTKTTTKLSFAIHL